MEMVPVKMLSRFQENVVDTKGGNCREGGSEGGKEGAREAECIAARGGIMYMSKSQQQQKAADVADSKMGCVLLNSGGGGGLHASYWTGPYADVFVI